ncbi:hypothetical protein ACFLYW_01900 [Thermodesulfobacteriota bacterium]
MYSNLYKNKKEITTRQVAEHLFDFAEKIYEKSKGNVLEIPVLKSEPPPKQAKFGFEYYCLLHSMITLIAWNSLDATKNQRNKIVRLYFEICRESLIGKAQNEKQGKHRFYTLTLRRKSYGKAYSAKTNMNPFFNCGQLFRKIYDLIQYYSDPEADKTGLTDKDIVTMPNWWLEKYIEKDNQKASKELLKVKENIKIPLQKITVTVCNEFKKLVNEGHKGVTITD